MGTTVRVAGQRVDVPAISKVRLCHGGLTVPRVRVEFEGPGCETACYSVYAGGDSLSAGTLTVSWVENVEGTETPKQQVVSPEDAGPPVEETCVLSTGAPKVANPDCLVAVGVVPPPDAIAPIVDEVDQAVGDAITTALAAVATGCNTVPDEYNEETWESVDFCTNPSGWTLEAGDDAYDTSCNTLPDRQDPSSGATYDACTNPVGWADSFAREVLGTACANVPDRYDPSTGAEIDFCTDPGGWALSAGGDAVELTCASIPDWYDAGSGQSFDFCTDPVGWSAAVGRYSIDTTCNAFPPVYDDWGREIRFCNDAVGWINAWVEDAEQWCDSAAPAYDYDTGQWVYPCSQPGPWISTMLENWCGDLCDIPTIQELIRDIRVIIAEQQIKIYWSHA